MGQKRKTCCICGLKQSKRSSQKEIKAVWRLSKSYEKDFECCFAPKAEGRSGDICRTCRSILVQKFRTNRDKCFSHILDCKITLNSKLDDDDDDHNSSTILSFDSPSESSVVLADISNTCTTTITATSTTNEDARDDDKTCKLDTVTLLEPELPPSPTTRTTASPTCHASQSSPGRRKRLRDECELPNRLTRSRIEEKIRSPVKIIKSSVSFLGKILPGDVVGHILGYLEADDIINVTLNFIVPETQHKANEEQTRLVTNLENFVHVDKYGPLTQPQKAMLGKLIENRENNLDENSCIVVPHVGSGGKSKRFLKVPKIQISSGDAQKRTKNLRSQFIERVESLISTPLNTDDRSLGIHVHTQRVNNIARDKAGYAAAAEEAGLKIVSKFSRETILSLRSVMTLRMWRMLKRVFTSEVGWDVFGSVGCLQKELKQIEFDYECGTVTSSTGDKVNFVRVSDVSQVISQLVNDLRKAEQLRYLDNLNPECLWLHVAADKGGKTTKLILQVINQKSRHSMDYAKLIGNFEGKDNRANLESIFGPILSAIQECIKEIANLKLTRPLPQTSHVKSCKDSKKCDENIPWKPLQPFDPSNSTVSDACKYCERCCCTNTGPSNVDTPHEPLPHLPLTVSNDDASPPGPTPDQFDLTPSASGIVQCPDQSAEGSDVLSPALSSQQSCDQSFQKPCPMPASSSQSDAQLRNATTENRSQTSDILSPRMSSSTVQCFETPRRQKPGKGGPQPRKLLTQLNAVSASRSDVQDETNMFTSCKLTVGGDWEGLAKFVGLSGSNGKYFCNHCLVQLNDVKKGVPHAEHIFPKYKSHVQDSAINPDYTLRTFDHCKEMNAKYKEAGEKAKALQFESCENAPLLEGGHIIDVVSTTPLHISLHGLGLQVLNIIEKEAINLDNDIKKRGGHHDSFTSTYERKYEILLDCRGVYTQIEELDDEIQQVVERKKEIIKDRASFFNKNHGSYKTDIAQCVRDNFAKLGTEKVALEKEKEKLSKSLKSKENKLEKVMKELEEIKGPFKERLDTVLDSFKLKRAAYHSGALIGPDVKKLVTKANISKLGEVFQPMEVIVYSDTSSMSFQTLNTFGSDQLRVKIVALLTKLRLCYELYTANRTLCRHEVEILGRRCVSYGNWFPVNFPQENLKRKFHLLTHDVPKQARRLKSTGIITEQTIESIHPYINELDRRFAKVSNKAKKGLIICKQQNMYSQASWNAVKKR